MASFDLRCGLQLIRININQYQQSTISGHNMDVLTGWRPSEEEEIPDTDDNRGMTGKKDKTYWVKCYNHDNAARE